MSDPVPCRPERIQKILSAHGIASRRKAEKMILDGRVTVNGMAAKLGGCALLGHDMIAVDGVPINQVRELVYIMLNKPRGYVTTMSDERGRKTVAELVADAGVRVYPVGRLDIASEGLLLMTNDGRFAYAVTHPSSGVTKTYRVKVRGDVVKAAALLRQPMEIDSRIICAKSVMLKKRGADAGTLIIKILEGRNRQIRKMCATCGLTVESLRRESISFLRLGNLETGRWRYLTEKELEAFNHIHNSISTYE